jgi:hypothetical protein
VYQFITKLIANRVQPYITNVISPRQTTFIKGHNIADNSNLMQEAMFLNANFFIHVEGYHIPHMRYVTVYVDFHADVYMRFFIIFK